MPDVLNRLQGARSTLGVKTPCRVATTANITLSGLQTIDGVALAEGDRVLVKNQTSASQNGVRIASTGAWARSKDWDANSDVVQGTQVYVANGTAGAGAYILTTPDPIELGTDNVTFIRLVGGSPTGYVDFPEIAEPAAPAADSARFYAVDSAGSTKLAYKDSAGIASTLIVGVTGSVDNAIIRADGAGGTKVQASSPTVTDGGTISMTPTSISKGFLVGQIGATSSQVGPFMYNEIDVNDDMPVTGDTRTFGLYMQYNTGGLNGRGGKYGGFFNMNHNVASVTTGDHIALVSQCTSSVSDASGGELYSANAACFANSGCTALGVNGMEIDVKVDSGATVTRRCGMRVVNEGNSVASGLDAAYAIMSTTNGGGFKQGFALSTFFGQPGLATTGDWFGLNGAHTIANFANCATLTVTGNILNFPNIVIAGTGAITSASRIASNSATAGIGYVTGAGGTVTQLTDKSTSITLNKMSGAITLAAGNLTAGAGASFTWNNSGLVAGDIIAWSHESGGTIGGYTISATCGSGTATVSIRNITAGALNETPTLGFVVITGARA